MGLWLTLVPFQDIVQQRGRYALSSTLRDEFIETLDVCTVNGLMYAYSSLEDVQSQQPEIRRFNSSWLRSLGKGSWSYVRDAQTPNSLRQSSNLNLSINSGVFSSTDVMRTELL